MSCFEVVICTNASQTMIRTLRQWGTAASLVCTPKLCVGSLDSFCTNASSCCSLKVHLCSTHRHTYDFPIKISQQLKGVEKKVAPPRATQNRLRNRLRGPRGSRNNPFTMKSRLKVARKESVRLIIIHSLSVQALCRTIGLNKV